MFDSFRITKGVLHPLYLCNAYSLHFATPILEAETTHVDHYNYTYILASVDNSNLQRILHRNIFTHCIFRILRREYIKASNIQSNIKFHFIYSIVLNEQC